MAMLALPKFDIPKCHCTLCIVFMKRAIEHWFKTCEQQDITRTGYVADSFFWNGEFGVDCSVQVREHGETGNRDDDIIVTYLSVYQMGDEHPYDFVCLNHPDSELPTFPVLGTDGYEYEMYQHPGWGAGIARIWR